MKKALVLALTAFMVLAMATAAFAVEVSYEGKVAVKWSSDAKEGAEGKVDGFAEDALEAKVIIDFTKDYGNGVTAGVTTKVEAHADIFEDGQEEGEEGHGVVDPDELKKEFVFDSSGWIKVERDLFTVEASTGIEEQVGRDLKEFNITKAPGVGLDLNLIDGLTLKTVLNGGSEYNYLVKGEFAQDLFTLGGGYQNFVDDEGTKKSAIGVYGTLNLIDNLVINAEYGSRNFDLDAEGDDEDKGTAILLGAAYDWNALSAKAGFFMNDKFGPTVSKDDLDDEDWRINEAFKSTESALHEYFDGLAKASVIYADASYQVTDALSVNAYFDYLLSAKDEDDKDIKDDFEAVSYKVGASYSLGDLTLDGWYKAYVDSQVGAKASYTLAEGVTTSFEIDYNMFDDEDDTVVYTAKIEASF